MTSACLRFPLTQIAWAYVLFYIDINVGSLDLLANFIGWFLLAAAVKKLTEELPDFALLRPLSLGLGVWGVLCWPGLFQPPLLLSLIALIVRVYFDFQFFTDLSLLAARHQPQGRRLDRTFRWLRNAHVGLDTALTLAALLSGSRISVTLGSKVSFSLSVTLLLCGFALVIATIVCLFSLRNLFPKHTETSSDC